MPGPSNKGRGGKRRTKTTLKVSATNASSPGDSTIISPATSNTVSHPAKVTTLPACQTLDEDEITRCGKPATKGYPVVERCKEHYHQYRKLYVKYKQASKIVDEMRDGDSIPTKEQIISYATLGITLEKARWVRKYLEAIRVEKTGREIHSRRFFLKGEYIH